MTSFKSAFLLPFDEAEVELLPEVDDVDVAAAAAATLEIGLGAGAGAGAGLGLGADSRSLTTAVCPFSLASSRAVLPFYTTYVYMIL